MSQTSESSSQATGQQPDHRPTIGISMGDPAGIGAEVIIKALADPEIRKLARYVIFGLNELLAYTADLAEIEPFWWRDQHERFSMNGLLPTASPQYPHAIEHDGHLFVAFSRNKVQTDVLRVPLTAVDALLPNDVSD